MLACGGSDGSPSPAFAGVTVSMRSIGPGPCLMIVQVLAPCCSSLEQFCMCELEDHVEIGLGWCSCSHLEVQSPTTNSEPKPWVEKWQEEWLPCVCGLREFFSGFWPGWGHFSSFSLCPLCCFVNWGTRTRPFLGESQELKEFCFVTQQPQEVHSTVSPSAHFCLPCYFSYFSKKTWWLCLIQNFCGSQRQERWLWASFCLA